MLDDDPIGKAARFQKFFAGKQYEGLSPWDRERDHEGNYVPLRRRAPRVRYNLCKAICNRMVGFLMGANTLPEFRGEGLADALKWLRDSMFLKVIPPAFRKACIQGSVGITFGFRRGKLLVRSYARDQAWPLFDDSDELLALVCQFTATDQRTGKKARFRLVLDAKEEVWYVCDRTAGSDSWQEYDRFEHGFGFVPAVWVRHMSEEPGVADGESLLEEILPLQEAIDYGISRQDRALTFTADPQTIIQDENPEDVMRSLIKSPTGTWFLGKDAKAYFLEIDGRGIELQGKFTGALRQYALELSRVVLPDPEKVSGQMSGFMMRMLYESMIDLADELQPAWTAGLVELAGKILLATRQLAAGSEVFVGGLDEIREAVPQVEARSETVEVHHPWLKGKRAFVLPAFTGAAMNIQAFWGPYFDVSPEEEGKIVDSAVRAHQGAILSRQTAVEFVAPYLGVTDAEEEVRRIEVDRAAEGLDDGLLV